MAGIPGVQGLIRADERWRTLPEVGIRRLARVRLPRPQGLSRPASGAFFAVVCAAVLGLVLAADAVLPTGESLGSLTLVIVAAAAWLLPGRLALVIVLLAEATRLLDAVQGWNAPLSAGAQMIATAMVAALIWRASAVMAEAHRRATEKARLYHVASHELRSPLTAICGYLQLMEDGTLGPLPPALEEAVPGLVERTRRITALVEDVITAARPDDNFVLRGDPGRPPADPHRR